MKWLEAGRSEVAAPRRVGPCPPGAGLSSGQHPSPSQACPLRRLSTCLPVMAPGTERTASSSRAAGGNLRELCIPQAAEPAAPTQAAAQAVFRSALAATFGFHPPPPLTRPGSGSPASGDPLGSAKEVSPLLCFCSHPAYLGFLKKVGPGFFIISRRRSLLPQRKADAHFTGRLNPVSASSGA